MNYIKILFGILVLLSTHSILAANVPPEGARGQTNTGDYVIYHNGQWVHDPAGEIEARNTPIKKSQLSN